MSITYGVLNPEPITFKESINISLGRQIAKCALVLVKSNNNENTTTLSFLNANILNDRIYISMNDSVDNILNKIGFLLKDGEKEIVLKDVPLGTESYEQYEINLLAILNELNKIPFVNICIVLDTYLNDVLINIKKYSNKLRSLYVNVYGICIDAITSVNALLNYSINIPTLVKQVTILDDASVQLLIQANTICVKAKDISNTFGSVLWLLDLMFQLCLGGVSEVCFDMTDFNVVYAHMAYNLVSQNANIFNVNISTSSNITAYYTRNTKYHNFIIIHKDINEENIQVNISMSSSVPAKLYRLLTNQTVSGPYGISFGELTFDGSTDGLPISAVTKSSSTLYVGNTVNPVNNIYTFLVDKLSAVVLQIPLMQGGAYFENINKENEKNTIISVKPNTELGDVDAVPTTMSIARFKKEVQPQL